MSRKKVVRAQGRTVWAYDNAHDVAMAHLVDVALEHGLSEEVVSQWRNAATLRHLGFHYDDDGDVEPGVLAQMLRTVRERVIAAGDLGPDELSGWSVLGGADISAGVIRGGTLPAQSIVDVVDGLRAMVEGSLAPDPPNARWFLGPRTGRGTVPWHADV